MPDGIFLFFGLSLTFWHQNIFSVRLRGSIKRRLLFNFGIYFLISSVLATIVLFLDGQKNALDHLHAQLAQSKDLLHQARQNEKDFFNFETLESSYYQTGKSIYLTAHKLHIDSILLLFEQVHNSPIAEGEQMRQLMTESQTELLAYRSLFDSLVVSIGVRGFKDHGMEGYMRLIIREFDLIKDQQIQIILLSLRRNEKDYILRKENIYFEAANNYVNQLLEILKQHKSLSRHQKSHFMALCYDYKEAFRRLKTIESYIGFRKGEGLKSRISQTSDHAQLLLNQLVNLISEKVKNKAFWAKTSLYISLMLALVMVILLAFAIDKNLTKPIEALSTQINQAIAHGFDVKQIKPENFAKLQEINKLSLDYVHTLEQINANLLLIEEKNKLSERQNQLMKDSLRYALTIQQAILPEKSLFERYFQEHFIFFQPKDIVSGDFYWLFRKREMLFLAVVDCTGHGVPGAFMSLIAYTALNHIVDKQKIYAPDQILEALHENITSALKQNENKNADGMDLSIALLEKLPDERFDLTFSGARRNLYVFKDKQLHTLKGTKRSVGGKKRLIPPKTFNQTKIQVHKGDCLYMFTDGLSDMMQNHSLRIGTKGIEEKMLEASTLSFSLQSQFWRNTITKLSLNGQQKDDLTFVGIKL